MLCSLKSKQKVISDVHTYMEVVTSLAILAGLNGNDTTAITMLNLKLQQTKSSRHETQGLNFWLRRKHTPAVTPLT
jgi:succinylglutamate desuccinylase